jgi:hypothetical protein
MTDKDVMQQIEKLVATEVNLYSKGNLTNEEVGLLHELKIKLDRYWDFLRQRRALRNSGEDPDNAELRLSAIHK